MTQDFIKPISVKLKRINVKRVIGELVILNSPNIIREVKARWLIGESVKGGIIGEYSGSPLGQEYKSYKMALNPSAKGTVDLTLTGALGEGLQVKPLGQTEFLVFSIDEKYQKLGEKYGFEEFGLAEHEWKQMQEEIYLFALNTIMEK
ncbi:MAG: hypothetical protein GY740_17760, partial [Gammaproteobacteria bacterium]|nr:hypothetical protein [Gammaproteobacteria bacterium]